jgi:hypothetical protein
VERNDMANNAKSHSGKVTNAVSRQRAFTVKALDLLPKFLERVSDLSFPIENATVLIDHFGGRGATMRIGTQLLSPSQVIKSIPPYYFPVLTMDDLVVKAAHILKKRRESLAKKSGQVGRQALPLSVESLRALLTPVKFPIETAQEFIEAFNVKGPYLLGTRRATGEQIAHNVPEDAFPIKSVEALVEIAESLRRNKTRSRVGRLLPTATRDVAPRVAFKPGKGTPTPRVAFKPGKGTPTPRVAIRPANTTKPATPLNEE